MKLSKQISKNVEEDKFIKMQRYDIFISKMEQLAAWERNRQRRINKTLRSMDSAFVTSDKPYKDTLYFFNKGIQKGSDIEMFEVGFQKLKQTKNGKGNIDRPFEDYGLRELDISWRMQTMGDQFKKSLDQRIRFHHRSFAKTLNHIGDFGWKDIEIIKGSFDKLNQMLDQHFSPELITVGEPTLKEGVYGDYKNIIPKNYVFDGFQDSQEFNSYIQTLLDWKDDSKARRNKMKEEKDREIVSLERSMNELITTTSRLKTVQADMQASIDSLRQQYFKLQEAKDKYQFLDENKYIRLEMLELEELLVKGGYIDPDEALIAKSDQSFETRMDRASKIFYEYVSAYSPEMMSP